MVTGTGKAEYSVGVSPDLPKNKSWKVEGWLKATRTESR